MLMENQEKILQIGLDLFADRGYDAVGVQEIAENAGITKPTLYYYFGSKEGLLESILEKYFSVLFDDLETSAVYHRDVKSTLEAISRTYFSFAEQHLAFYRFQLACWFAPPQSTAFKAILPYLQKQQAMAESIFQQAAQDHGNMIGRHQRYALSFLGIINTYIGMKIRSQIELDETIVSTAVHQFMHGIFS